MNKKPFQSLEWGEGRLVVLDQRRLPHECIYYELNDHEEVYGAIRDMVVRGAPAIGLAAAYGVCLAAQNLSPDEPDPIHVLAEVISYLRESRPTAVNLGWALNVMEQALYAPETDARNLSSRLLQTAHTLFQLDIETNLSIARYGTSLLPDICNVIHHCNTGSLATADYGTALGIIRYAHESGKKIHAYLDETRPRFQGLALSAFELRAYNVPHTVIVDSAAAYVMNTRKIDCCIVGCDRVAANGDTANKIGTYALALAARAHNVPFYVACPTSSLDFTTPNGDAIEIEERSAREITEYDGVPIAPEGTSVFNPAFDVTPASLITAFITEKGIFEPQNLDFLAKGA